MSGPKSEMTTMALRRVRRAVHHHRRMQRDALREVQRRNSEAVRAIVENLQPQQPADVAKAWGTDVGEA